MRDTQPGHPSLNHGSAHDTLRWGDSHTFTDLVNAGGEAAPFLSRQMIAAHWRWPLSWNLWVALVPQFETGETGSFTVRLQTTIGVGQAITTFPIEYTIAPQAVTGVYLPVIDQRFIPAQDLQIIVQVFEKTTPTGVNDNLTVGLFVAPQTEPHAMTRMMDHILHGEGVDEVQWMQEGFTEAPMGYRR